MMGKRIAKKDRKSFYFAIKNVCFFIFYTFRYLASSLKLLYAGIMLKTFHCQ